MTATEVRRMVSDQYLVNFFCGFYLHVICRVFCWILCYLNLMISGAARPSLPQLDMNQEAAVIGTFQICMACSGIINCN